jgi:hypothetical protein
MGHEGRRYLYGDSAGLELGFDVLDMLRGLVDCIHVVGTAQGEIEALRRRLAESQRQGELISADLERFGDEARIGLGASGRQSTWSEVHQFADSMVSFVESSIVSWKEQHRRELQTSRTAIDTAVQDHQRTMRAALDVFLLERDLDVQSWAFEIRRQGDALAATLDWALPGDIRVAYELDEPSGWAAPFRVGELVTAFELEVGFKKKLLRKEPVPHRLGLADYFVVEARCVPTGARLSLVRKLTEPTERVELELRIEEGGVDGVVHDVGGGYPPKATAEIDLPQLSSLWSALYERVGDPSRNRRSVRGVWLGERAVEDAEGILAVVERLVSHTRPIVREIVSHSPNAAELSVKVDLGEGRREEIYVERDGLQRKLLDLPKSLLERLAFPSLLPPGTIDHDESLLDLSEIVEVVEGDSAVTVVSRLYPDASDRTDPSIPVVNVPGRAEDSQTIDLTELTGEIEDEDEPPTELHRVSQD